MLNARQSASTQLCTRANHMAQPLAWSIFRRRLQHQITLFDQAAFYDDLKQKWVIPFRGWAYIPYHGLHLQKFVMSTLEHWTKHKPNLDERDCFQRHAYYFFAQSLKHCGFKLDFDGRFLELLPMSLKGHFFSQIQIDASETSKGLVPYQVSELDNNLPQVQANIHFIPQEGISVISDIDDTVKDSHVACKRELLKNTFFKPFKAVPYIAEKYQQWSNENTHFHMVSSSPWQLYPALKRFFREEGFPELVMHLKEFRFSDKRLTNLFKKGGNIKYPKIENIIKQYPKHKFVLIGDNAEEDPWIFSSLYQHYSQQIQAIYIRDVFETQESKAKLKTDFAHVPNNLWTIFKDGRDLPNSILA